MTTAEANVSDSDRRRGDRRAEPAVEVRLGEAWFRTCDWSLTGLSVRLAPDSPLRAAIADDAEFADCLIRLPGDGREATAGLRVARTIHEAEERLFVGFRILDPKGAVRDLLEGWTLGAALKAGYRPETPAFDGPYD